MSDRPKNSSRNPRRGRPPSRKVGIPFTSSYFFKGFRSLFNNGELSDSSGYDESSRFDQMLGNIDISKTIESTSSTVGSKTNKVSSEGTGGKKVFKPKDLQIHLKEESKFWSIPEGDGPAELLKVCWLDVSGEMDVTKGNTYEVSFMLSMNTEKHHSFGWEVPVTMMARIGKKGKYQRIEIKLSDLSEEVKEFPPDKCRIEFKSEEKSESNEEKLYFGLYETWTNKWKGGLRIHEAIVQEITDGNDASTSMAFRITTSKGRE